MTNQERKQEKNSIDQTITLRERSSKKADNSSFILVLVSGDATGV